MFHKKISCNDSAKCSLTTIISNNSINSDWNDRNTLNDLLSVSNLSIDNGNFDRRLDRHSFVSPSINIDSYENSERNQRYFDCESNEIIFNDQISDVDSKPKLVLKRTDPITTEAKNKSFAIIPNYTIIPNDFDVGDGPSPPLKQRKRSELIECNQSILKDQSSTIETKVKEINTENKRIICDEMMATNEPDNLDHNEQSKNTEGI